MEKLKHKLHYLYKRRVILILSIILLAMMYLFQNSSFFLRSLTTILFLGIFLFIDHFFDIRFKTVHYVFIILIAIFSLLLSPIYFIYPSYDKFLHFIQPIIISSLVFFMMTRLKLKLKWQLTFTFFVTLGILGLFEIGEYVLDLLFDWKLQGVYLRDAAGIDKFNLIQEPLDDTMIDLALGVAGSALYTISIGLSRFKELFK